MRVPFPPRWRGPAAALLALLATMPAPQPGQAADIVPYDVTIAETGAPAIDDVIRQTSSLAGLRDSAQVGPFALVLRARDDVGRMQAVLNAQGYYAGTVRVTVDGRALDDPDLPDALDALPAGRKVTVAVALELGPEFTLGRITVNGAAGTDVLGLRPGAPVRAAEVLAAKDRLLASLQAQGYALARVAEPVATLDAPARAVNVAFEAQPGPRVALGAISFLGLDSVDEAFARQRLGLRPGERFDPARLAQARQDLVAAGTFSSVMVEPANAVDASGTLPVTVRVTERKLRVVNLGAAFSTDQGGSASASWGHRNLFGGAEQLTLSAAVTQLGGTANSSPGYSLGAVLTIPDWLQRDQKLVVNVTALREYLRAYDRTGGILGATVSRPLNPHLTASLGLGFTQEQVVQEGTARDYSLLQVTAGLKYDTTDDLLDPKRGWRGNVTLTPSVSFGGIAQSNFVIGQASVSAYFDVSGTGRTILAGRALVGAIMGAGALDLPPDQRFYGGGSGTIRGFRYQSVGPQFRSGRPIGGTAVQAATLEVRQRILADWGAVAFVDAGQVSAQGVPFGGKALVGAGAGVRYYTAIGPVRLDVAVPVTSDRKGDAFELYIGLGHAF